MAGKVSCGQGLDWPAHRRRGFTRRHTRPRFTDDRGCACGDPVRKANWSSETYLPDRDRWSFIRSLPSTAKNCNGIGSIGLSSSALVPLTVCLLLFCTTFARSLERSAAAGVPFVSRGSLFGTTRQWTAAESTPPQRVRCCFGVGTALAKPANMASGSMLEAILWNGGLPMALRRIDLGGQCERNWAPERRWRRTRRDR